MRTSLVSAGSALLVALALTACGAPAGGADNATPSGNAAPTGGIGAPRADEISQPRGATGVISPCQRDFMDRDKNSDGFISLAEWLESEKGKTFIQSPEAAFKQKDANGDGKLDKVEFGCETPTPGATPNGRG